MESGTFSLTIADVFAISDRGDVVTGRVAGAPVRINDSVVITGGGKVKEAVVSGVAVYREMIDMAGV
jgi:translation elongation factor EF-Tu-like GTPase